MVIAVAVAVCAVDLTNKSLNLCLLISCTAIAVLTSGRSRSGRSRLGLVALLGALINHAVWALLGAWEVDAGSVAHFSIGRYLANLATVTVDTRFLVVTDLGWWGPLTWPVVSGIVTLYLTLLAHAAFWAGLAFRSIPHRTAS